MNSNPWRNFTIVSATDAPGGRLDSDESGSARQICATVLQLSICVLLSGSELNINYYLIL